MPSAHDADLSTYDLVGWPAINSYLNLGHDPRTARPLRTLRAIERRYRLRGEPMPIRRLGRRVVARVEELRAFFAKPPKRARLRARSPQGRRLERYLRRNMRRWIPPTLEEAREWRVHRATTQTIGQSSYRDRLRGWKEIANYLGVGVRQAQKLCARRGLPVWVLDFQKRPTPQAYKHEIERWKLTWNRKPGPRGPWKLQK